MKKKLFIVGIIVIALGGVGALFGQQYYENRFFLNTEFASVDISNLTQAEANDKVKESFSQQTINFTEDDRKWESLMPNDLGITFQPEEILASLMTKQHQQNWLQGAFMKTQINYEPQDLITIDDKQLLETLTSNNRVNGPRFLPTDAKIAYSETEGYYIDAAQVGTELDVSIMKDQIIQAITNQQTVDVSQAYLQPMVTAEDPTLQAELEQIQALTSMKITLTIAGYEEVITPEMIYSWLIFDETNGEYSFDEEMIYDYLGTLNDAYATYDDFRYFESTLQGQVELLPGTLGWSIDRETETQAIIDDLTAGESVTREPAIVGIGYNGTLDDIGTSYIEVDMTYQMMYLYLDGVEAISTPIVTGQIGTNTVPGAYAIWNMESPSQLTGFNPRTGVDYVQPVEYWLAFDYTGQGIHDANWQPTFGGDAYLTNGSLGCVNTPPEIMAQLFEYVYNGLPVLVFE